MIPGLAHWLSTGPIASTLPVEWTSRFPADKLPYYGVIEAQNRICKESAINSKFKINENIIIQRRR